ncbi:MAG TPA: aspartate carbamoyltransferase [Nitrospirales bacterium]|nr:aspartate carbamoyltransferase [Nitrospirales bacterium]HIO21327.1 aspartate carbamoyltransferase [Nitrospirales bacterium]HIO69351.1 aspartate carbamoyltransferase [Nitrospirales bacterium]
MIDEFTATQQLGFIFKADNCIGCHSCEAACSEKNGLPSHVAWRKVGYLEGGTYPDHARVNISMACNHCDDPVCLKGCPTGAYVKYQDTGAVVVDSDICFGCRYCTWVCPYEAPAFNPATGSVSKCNMCVDLLEQNLQPACVDACLGHALEFGEIEKYERDNPEVLTQIAGFPDPYISKPNVRFEQSRSLPTTMNRADTELIQYQSNENTLPYHSVGKTSAAPDAREKEPWSSLHSHETSLVAFTLLAQFVVGAFLSVWSLPLLTSGVGLESSLRAPTVAILVGITGLLAVGLGVSTAHLGKPWRCYRSLNNLRYSWVSREILAMGLFFGSLTLFTMLTFLGVSGPWVYWGLGSTVVMCGIASIFTMSKIYIIPARPFWNHSHTWVSFYASAFMLGPYLVAAVLGLLTPISVAVLAAFTAVALTVQVIRSISQRVHLQNLVSSPQNNNWNQPFGPLTTQTQATLHVQGEADTSRDRLFGKFGRFQRMRNALSYLTMSISAVTLATVVATATFGSANVGMWMMNLVSTVVPWVILFLFVTALVGELIGRALFYSVVTPTTMPGSLFLNNRGFEQLARDTGLANNQTVGVFPH